MARWIPIDPEDVQQERELARLEGRDPEQAARAYRRQEHRFYDWIAHGMEQWIDQIGCDATPVTPRANRSPESIERRRAYTREWWRIHGREYRRQRRTKQEVQGDPTDSAPLLP